MKEGKPTKKELLPHLYRQEYAKITAFLCRFFGLEHIEIAEDIASDTFLKATEHWAINGVPNNPPAWLYTVAKNKARDFIKRAANFDTKIKNRLPSDLEINPDFELNEQIISDSQLAMIFAVCNPVIPPESQICLALQILCGFSLEEISNAFLTKPQTIKKRLQRARAKLRHEHMLFQTLHLKEIQSRLDTVLKTLYLLYNEGYFSRTGDRQIRIELCSEATRLTKLLTENAATNSSETNALLALMCYQSSRLNARVNEKGEPVLYEKQDKSLWDKSLIDLGNHYLVEATNANKISRYHLEAAIAYWHTTPTDQNKWHHILHLYNQLILIEYSPITALNRTFAYAKVYGNKKALPEALKLNLAENSHYHQLLGFLYSDTEIPKAISHFSRAISLTKSKIEKHTLKKEIKRLKTHNHVKK